MVETEPMADYRVSHTAPGKGRKYQAMYDTLPGLRYMWEQEQAVLRKLIRKYCGAGEIRLLDFACGTGRVLSCLQHYVTLATGIDVSETMLDVCRQQRLQVELIQADITHESALQDRIFNLITAFRFFPNAQPTLRHEAMRCLVSHLTQDGLLIFNNHENHSGSIYRVARILGKRLPTMHHRDALDLIQSHGLELIDLVAIGVLPFSTHCLVVPQWTHRLADTIASVCGVRRSLAQNIIYICRKRTN
jgi:SAM-dependent methyltransferase